MKVLEMVQMRVPLNLKELNSARLKVVRTGRMMASKKVLTKELKKDWMMGWRMAQMLDL